jgi:hypothetical protein
MGCASSPGFGTFTGPSGGVCDAFERPPYQVLGKTPYDQDVADKWTEAGVAGCKWERPGARPAELDAVAAINAVVAPKPAPAKKVSIWKRVKSKFSRKPKLPEVTE